MKMPTIVDVADDFYEAYVRCGEEKNFRKIADGRYTADVVNIPVIVNGVFALELYLKSLVSERKRKSIGHDISKLFSAIDHKYQEKIKERVEKELKMWQQTFDDALQGISNAFEHWRYIYEKPDFGYGLNPCLHTLPLFLDPLREIIKGKQKTD